MLELYVVKATRTVPRRERGGNPSDLADVRQEVASSCNNISAELSAVLVVKTFPSETASEVILEWVA